MSLRHTHCTTKQQLQKATVGLLVGVAGVGSGVGGVHCIADVSGGVPQGGGSNCSLSNGSGIAHCGCGVAHCGGGIPQCGGGIAHCGGSIAHCGGGIAHRGGSISHCGGGIAPCRGGISHCGGGIAHCRGGIAHCGGGNCSPCDGSGDTQRRGNSRYGGGDSHRGGHLSDGSSDYCGFTVDDSVESVDGVSGIIDGTTSAVGFHQAVAALDDVSVTRFVLALRVAGQSVLDVVSVAVLGVRVVVSVDGHGGSDLGDGGGRIGEGSGDLCDSGGGIGQGSGVCVGGVCGGGIRERCVSDSRSCVGHRGGHCAGRYDGWGADDSGSGDCHNGGEDEQLEVKGPLDTAITG